MSPTEEINVQHMITINTSHCMPSARPVGRKEDESRLVMACS